MKAAADGVDVKKQYNHRDPTVDWSDGCRITHGESTYYHSVMGHKEKEKEKLFV